MILNETITILERNYRLKDTHLEAGEGLRGKPMLLIGGTSGVRLSNIKLDCNGIAGAGISAWDLESCKFSNVEINYPTKTGVYLIGMARPLMRCRFEFLRVQARGAEESQQASGVIMDSQDTDIANVCFCRFEDCYFDVAKGVAVDMRDADNVTMLNTHCINLGDGYALRIDKRPFNTLIVFEPHLGKVYVKEWKANNVIGWSEGNGGKPWGSYTDL